MTLANNLNRISVMNLIANMWGVVVFSRIRQHWCVSNCRGLPLPSILDDNGVASLLLLDVS